MNLRGINRIVVAVRNLEASKKFYTQALGATFQDANWTGETYGLDVSISWDAGIELCSPMAGRESDSIISPYLEKNGEGIMTVFVGVNDADKAVAQAQKAGLAPNHSLDYTQDEMDMHLDGLFKKYKEFVLDSSEKCGFGLALAQIETK